MKKYLRVCLVSLILLLGIVELSPTLSFDATACSKCNTSDTNRKCGKCGSNRLFSDPNKKDKYENGYMIFYYKCSDCGHETSKRVKS